MAKLADRLVKFDLAKCVAAMAGLLTDPSFHANAARLEALLHLVVLSCKGSQPPTASLLKQWLNEVLLKDAVGNVEDPAEDVFVSNVVTGDGNALLFEGIWEANGAYTQSSLYVLTDLQRQGEEWASHGLRQATALLRLSSAVSKRGGLTRYTVERSKPRERLAFSSGHLAGLSGRVLFRADELGALDIHPFDLTPFLFDLKKRDVLRDEAIIWTELERRPILKIDEDYVLALPTAVGAAIRRRAIQMAVENDKADMFDEALASYQEQRFVLPAVSQLGLKRLRPTTRDPGTGVVEMMFEADVDRVVQVLFTPDNVASIHKHGFNSTNECAGIGQLVKACLDEFKPGSGTKAGATWIIFGGLGRGVSVDVGPLPEHWFSFGLGFEDLELLASSSGVSALMLLRLLEQERALTNQGVRLVNPNGFLNLFGFAKHNAFALLPENAAPGQTLLLGTDYLTDVRTSVRQALDKHAVRVDSERRYAEVERQSSQAYFADMAEDPTFFSVSDAMQGRWAVAVEVASTTWWIHLSGTTLADPGSLRFRVWDMARSWLAAVAQALDTELPRFRPSFVDLELFFEDEEEPDADAMLSMDDLTRPRVDATGGKLRIWCPRDYLRSFGRPENIGDRWMIEAIVEGALALAQVRDTTLPSKVSGLVVGSSAARHLHVMVPKSAGDAVLATADIPPVRLVQAEVRAWAEIGLAQRSGLQEGQAGEYSSGGATKVLQKAVEQLWAETRERLEHIDRQSLIERGLKQHDAIDRDRSTWRHTAAALLVLHPQSETLRVATDRESARADAGLCSRVAVEMAVCASPVTGGRPCSLDDFDQILARISLLTSLASRSDEIHHGFAERIDVRPNGTFRFEDDFAAGIHRPYMITNSHQQFQAAADSYAAFYEQQDDIDEAEYEARSDPVFDAAFAAEYGVTPIRMADLVSFLGGIAVRNGASLVIRSRKQLVADILALDGVSPVNAEKLVTAWSLAPRKKWDDQKPSGARRQDWYPWRHQRRLSLLARPIVQLEAGEDAKCIVAPVIAEHALSYALRAHSARLPVSFFSSEEMQRWIGATIDKLGHDFNTKVAARLLELGLDAEAEVLMTQFGGKAADGDVDVVAWNDSAGHVYAIECKRLLPDKTVGEIAERLIEFGPDYHEPDGRRGPTRRHLDRLVILRNNADRIAKITGIEPARQQLISCLVTSALVPMQFQKNLTSSFEVIADFDQLHNRFLTAAP